MIFGGGGSESNTPNNILPGFASSGKSPTADSSSAGDNSGDCIQSQGTGKDYYCAGTHHHCVKRRMTRMSSRRRKNELTEPSHIINK